MQREDKGVENGHFSVLPDELILDIFRRLSLTDLINLSLVAKPTRTNHLYRISQDHSLWGHLFHHRIPLEDRQDGDSNRFKLHFLHLLASHLRSIQNARSYPISNQEIRTLLIAAYLGNLAKVKLIKAKITAIAEENDSGDMLWDIDGCIFSIAASFNHVEMAEWLYSEMPNAERRQQLIEYEEYGAICRAAAHGHLNIVEWIWEKSDASTQSKILVANDFQIMRDAIKSGHIKIVEWAWNKTDVATYTTFMRFFRWQPYIDAVHEGHTDVTTFLWDKSTPDMREDINKHLNTVPGTLTGLIEETRCLAR